MIKNQRFKYYKELLSKTRYDVFESVKGQYLFTEFDEAHNEYLSIVPFSTEEELKFLIASGVANDISCCIESSLEDASIQLKEIGKDAICEIDDYKTFFPRLFEIFNDIYGAILRCDNLLESTFQFFHD